MQSALCDAARGESFHCRVDLVYSLSSTEFCTQEHVVCMFELLSNLKLCQ